MMKRMIVGLTALGLFSWFAVSALAHEMEGHADRGAATIKLNGGMMPEVTFPHRMHQDELSDCTLCHDLFQQKSGAIKDAITAGKLKKKQVMKAKCLTCHRQRKAAGQPAGPTACNRCHVRNKK